jgi:hypothetical protein
VVQQLPVFVLEGQQLLAFGSQVLLHVSGRLMQLLVDDVFVGLVGDGVGVVVVVESVCMGRRVPSSNTFFW